MSNLTLGAHTAHHPASEVGARTFLLDPLDEDLPSDRPILTTARGLCRLATVATEAGARYQRDGLAADPMDWMTSPRDLFHGGVALEACLAREPFLRGVMVHALSLRLDVDPDEMDLVLADDGAERATSPKAAWGRQRRGKRSAGRLLYTATISHTSPSMMIQAFHASFACDPSDVLHRLIGRFGAEVAASAEIRLGYNPASPLTIALVNEPVAQLIRDVESGIALVRPCDFSVDIEQRIEV